MRRYFFIILPIVVILILLYPKSQHPKYRDLVKLTGFSEPSYRVFWYEPRFRLYQKAKYEPYPEMPPCDRLRFVYKLSPKEQKNATK